MQNVRGEEKRLPAKWTDIYWSPFAYYLIILHLISRRKYCQSVTEGACRNADLVLRSW